MRGVELKSYSAYFWNRWAAFSLDACCLFPQCMLAFIPLIWGVQVQRPLCAPRTVGAMSATCFRVFYGQLLSVPCQDSRDRAHYLLVDLVVVASAHLWSPRWQWLLMPTPGAPLGGVLLPGNTQRERSYYGGPAPLLIHSQIMVPCLFGRPRLILSTPSAATAQPFQALSTQPTLVLSLRLTSEA